ncbi:MAG: DUF302 domain-containing protein [Actinomycetota bacterium]
MMQNPPSRRRPLGRLVAAFVVVAALVAVTVTPVEASGKHRHRARAPRVAGMVIVESDQDLESSWSAVIGALEANPNIGIVAQIDHAAAAASVGLELAPNRVVVFGNPALGSPLMARNQVTGIDLPQKIHVFEQHGRVWVGFNDTTYLRARHRLGDAPTLDTIAGALRNLARVAADRDLTEARSRGAFRFRPRPGLITLASDADVDTTWDRLLDAIEASPANVAYQVDHQAGAAGVGVDLRPTRLVVFGNPNLGTPLMQARPTAGIDLPIRFLVWEDAEGQVWVTTNDERLARRHRLRRADLDAIAGAVENFLTVATTS